VVAVEFRRIRDTQPHPFADTWADLVTKLSEHRENVDKTTGKLWSPVTYVDGARRSLAGVDRVHAFVLDLDDTPLDVVRPELAGLTWLAYSTFSFDGETGCHLVVPFVESVDAWEWEAVWNACFVFFGSVGDRACRDASRAFYQPQHPPGGKHFVEHHEGQPLDVTSLPNLKPSPAQPSPAQPRRRVRPYGSRRGNEPPFLSEAWWNEPQDLSEYEGLTEQEMAVKFRAKLARIRAEIEKEEAGV